MIPVIRTSSLPASPFRSFARPAHDVPDCQGEEQPYLYSLFRIAPTPDFHEIWTEQCEAGDPSRAIRLEAAVTQGEVWKSALHRRFVSLRLAVHRRFIRAFEGRLGSRTLRALSTPATGSLPASIKPSCTSTEA